MMTAKGNLPFRDSGYCDKCGIDFNTHLFNGGPIRVNVVEPVYSIRGTLIGFKFSMLECYSYEMRIIYDDVK